MRISRLLWAIALGFGLVAMLVAQEAQVTYEDGTVQVKAGAAWKNLNIGDKLAADAVIKLDKNSSLEFKAGSANVVITRPGTYNLKDILAAQKKTESSGVAKTLQSSFSQMIGATPAQKQSTTAGVRAANKSESNQPTWVTSDTQSLVDTGTAFLKSGKYAEALAKFREAQDEATDDEMPQVQYLMAYAQTLTGDIRGALKQVNNLTAPADAEWASDFILLKARLLEESYAWPEAIDWLNKQGAVLANDANRGQLYHFMLGLAYVTTGDAAKAKLSLNKTISLGKDTDLGKTAASLLQN